MTLPTDINLPLPKGGSQIDDGSYIKELTSSLESMYEKISGNVNGYFRNYADADSTKWLPLLKGTTLAGEFTYVNQIGWSLRSGIMTEVFFDVSWTATTATGNLYLELPYLVTKSSGKPFVGHVQTSDVDYGTSQSIITCNAIPSTFRLEMWSSGSTTSTANMPVQSSGQLIGTIRYIGISDE